MFFLINYSLLNLPSQTVIDWARANEWALCFRVKIQHRRLATNFMPWRGRWRWRMDSSGGEGGGEKGWRHPWGEVDDDNNDDNDGGGPSS